MTRLLIFTGLLLLAGAANATVGNQWYTDSACSIKFDEPNMPGIVGGSGTGTKKVLYYCPVDGLDSTDIVVYGTGATAIWWGDTSSPPGNVTLNVYTGCVGASPPAANCIDVFSGSQSLYQQMAPGDPSAILTIGPGRYRFHPSSSAATGVLEVRGN